MIFSNSTQPEDVQESFAALEAAFPTLHTMLPEALRSLWSDLAPCYAHLMDRALSAVHDRVNRRRFDSESGQIVRMMAIFRLAGTGMTIPDDLGVVQATADMLRANRAATVCRVRDGLVGTNTFKAALDEVMAKKCDWPADGIWFWKVQAAHNTIASCEQGSDYSGLPTVYEHLAECHLLPVDVGIEREQLLGWARSQKLQQAQLLLRDSLTGPDLAVMISFIRWIAEISDEAYGLEELGTNVLQLMTLKRRVGSWVLLPANRKQYPLLHHDAKEGLPKLQELITQQNR